MPLLRIGTSGWQYGHWREVFYAKRLPATQWLAHYFTHFNTVEINSSFYHTPKEEAFDRWREAAPKGFLYAVKGTRYVTHLRKLSGIAEAVAGFVARAARLREHLGPILWQLPPGLHYQAQRLSELLASLPVGYRYALEVRHPTWVADEPLGMLRNAGVAICIADTPARRYLPEGRGARAASPDERLYPYTEAVTADLVYVRLHGHKALYGSEYTEAELQDWAAKARRWYNAGLDVFIYFDNDAFGYAVRNALRLKEILGA